MIQIKRPSALRQMLKPWITPELMFFWVADGSDAVMRPQKGAELIPGGIANTANGGPYLTGRLPFTLPSASPFYICMLVTPQNAASQSGAFLKIGDDSSGIGFGCGSGNFETVGSQLLLLREGVSWDTVGVTGSMSAGMNFMAAGTLIDYGNVFQLVSVTSGAAVSGASTWISAVNTIHINGYTALSIYERGASAVVHAVAIWSTSKGSADWHEHADSLRRPVLQLEGFSVGQMRALCRPTTQRIKVVSGYTHPTLSNARMGSLTSTGGVPQVTFTRG